MRVLPGVLVGAMLAAGCGPTWPSGTLHANAPHPDHAITTVDVLPLDLELWTEAGQGANPDDLRGQAEASLANTALDALVKRAYVPSAMIDWNGDFAGGGQALEQPALMSTIGALAHYGIAAPPTPGSQLPIPHLPAHLGDKTGSDATLYIGGWSYVAAYHESTGSKIAKDVAIGLIVVVAAVVVIAAIAAVSDDKHHSSSHSKGGVSEPDHRALGGGGVVSRWHGHDEGGVRVHVNHRGESGEHAFVRTATDLAADIAIDTLDVYGRMPIDEDESHPDYADDPNLPHGGESRMYLQMTLVDNRTGLALWHAHQTFPASGASQEDVSRAARMLLASLPQS